MAFPPEERAFLLQTPRLGPVSVSRLEAAGIHAVDLIATLGASRVIEIAGTGPHGTGWLNRRRAMEAAVSQWIGRARVDR